MSDQQHLASERALLDDRGYTGPLIRGANPALLFEKAVRDRITESYYWKEQCFGLNEATLCDRAVELTAVGGTFGDTGRPTPFLCLAFKLCQLVPEERVVREYLNFDGEERERDGGGGEDEEEDEDRGVNGVDEGAEAGKKRGVFKYLRALAAFYIRLAWSDVEIYKTLEPLLADRRKIRRRTRAGFRITYMDEFVDELLTKNRACATSLWPLQSRMILEDLDKLEPRVSPLGEEVDMLDEEDGDGEGRTGFTVEEDMSRPVSEEDDG
ncbi:hypothetical protein LTS18_001607 [Coniosporium uncinatum]|uniref:Uncharacterized protein n=1 Tax=Coniosporium uncinatum TaxID=93489 RepID=A0ACC3DEU3_9PEZI|nr:hypothetical protein LTS18_001607 [Coniosporium uncinatum]